MDKDFLHHIKTEVEEEVSFFDPPEMEPLCSEDQTCSDLPTLEIEHLSTEQGEFYDEIDVKEESLVSEEEEGTGQFVLENEEVKVTEVKQEYAGQYSMEDKTIWLPETVSTASKPPKSEYCQICKKLFFDMPGHLSSVHLQKTIICGAKEFKIIDNNCPLCEMNFNDINQLRKHLRVVHLKFKDHRCPCCRKEFFYERNVIQHLKKVHDIIPNNNHHLGNSNKYVGKLRDYTKMNPDLVKESRSVKEISTSWIQKKICKICNIHYSDISQHLIDNHNATCIPFHYNNTTYNIVWTYCPVCQKEFRNVNGVRSHIKSVHSKDHSQNKTQDEELDQESPISNEANINVPLNNLPISIPVATTQNVLPQINYDEMPPLRYFSKTEIAKETQCNLNICEQRTQQLTSPTVKQQENIVEQICSEKEVKNTSNILLEKYHDKELMNTNFVDSNYVMGDSDFQVIVVNVNQSTMDFSADESAQSKNEEALNNSEMVCDILHSEFQENTPSTSSMLDEDEPVAIHPCSDSKNCDFCGELFDTEADLRTHIETIHLEEHKICCVKCSSYTCWVVYLQQYFLSFDCYEEHSCGKNPVIKLVSIDYILEKVGEKICGESKIENKFHCQMCLSNFNSEEKLVSHIKKHIKYKVDTCLICCDSFLGCFLLDKLIGIAPQKIYNFNCDICTKGFETYYLLQQHKRRVHCMKIDSDKYKCKECHRTFKTSRILWTHQKDKHNKCYCTQCCGIFIKKERLLEHIKLVHSTTEQKMILNCNLCSFATSTAYELFKHMATEHLKRLEIYCRICRKIFTSKTDFWSHNRSRHKVEISKEVQIDDDQLMEIKDSSINSDAKDSPHSNQPHFFSALEEGEPSSSNSQDNQMLDTQPATTSAVNLYSTDMSTKTDNKPYLEFLCIHCGILFKDKTNLVDHLTAAHNIIEGSLSEVQNTNVSEVQNSQNTNVSEVQNSQNTNVSEVQNTNVSEVQNTNISEVQNTNVSEVQNSQNTNVSEVQNTNISLVQNANISEVQNSQNTNVSVTYDKCSYNYDRCKLCCKILTAQLISTSHECIHENHIYYTCNVCCQRFSSTRLSHQHFKEEHNSMFKHSCKQCGKLFLRLYGLQEHIKMKHSGVKSFNCKFFKACYNSKHSLTRHNTRCKPAQYVESRVFLL